MAARKARQSDVTTAIGFCGICRLDMSSKAQSFQGNSIESVLSVKTSYIVVLLAPRTL
jgi:D-arabinose 1-dehydrogenase-like Zn-dependent alcohol dehydrogenase